MRHVALLRGINVGGKNLVPMRDLASLFEKAGARAVTTYIQSGNVVFTGPPAVTGGIAARIAADIERRFGHRVPVVVRTAKEIEAVAKKNPFLEPGSPTDALHVLFLADKPTPKSVASLDPERSPRDSFVVVGREIYLRCPNGVGKTRLTNAYFDSKLATTSTGRNWRTVLKLVELATAKP